MIKYVGSKINPIVGTLMSLHLFCKKKNEREREREREREIEREKYLPSGSQDQDVVPVEAIYQFGSNRM